MFMIIVSMCLKTGKMFMVSHALLSQMKDSFQDAT